MKLIIIKFKTIISDECTEKITEKLNASLSKGVLLLDGSCDYEVVDLEVQA